MRLDFAESPRSTLGLEWELALVDTDSGDMRQAGPSVLDALMRDGKPHPHVHPEFLRNTVEMVSKVSRTVGEAAADIAQIGADIRAVTNPMRVELMGAGTHPFSRWTTQKVTERDRYQLVVDRAQLWGRQLLIYGVHTHVGVEDRRKVLPLIRALLCYVPHLQAISASSPFFDGRDTGFASMRSQLFQQLPTAGLPYQFKKWSQLERYVSDLTNTGVIESFGEVRWDIRPSPRYGTIEVRVCDGVSNLFELRVLAAITQCLVEHLSSRFDSGDPLPTMRQWYVEENKWRAARYGLDARIIINNKGRVAEVREEIDRLVVELTPTARRLGCEADLLGARRIMQIGASYQRQRAVAQNARQAGLGEHEALEAVVMHLLNEMRADAPIPV